LIGVKVGGGGARYGLIDQDKERTDMTHTPHELAEEFPEKIELMSDLKQSNAHFAKLADEYHELNRAVHRAETNVEPISEAAETELRKKRAVLKDEIWGILSKT
jgi:uncharacterized protein YdcH (DUF465 family)